MQKLPISGMLSSNIVLVVSLEKLILPVLLIFFFVLHIHFVLHERRSCHQYFLLLNFMFKTSAILFSPGNKVEVSTIEEWSNKEKKCCDQDLLHRKVGYALWRYCRSACIRATDNHEAECWCCMQLS